MKMPFIWFVWYTLQSVTGMKQDICPQMCMCRSSDIHTDCRYNSLTKLPEGIFPQVMRLDLSFNQFTHIPDRLSTFEKLEYLNLSHNQIKNIDIDSLHGVKALLVLDLSYNSFTEWLDIKRDSLIEVPLLQELDLSYNGLHGFPDVMDHPLNSNSLETLSLVNCSITNLLGDILSGLLNLKNLMLANNPLMGLNTQIKSRKLLTLDLSQCSLQRIHPDAFLELTSLETLKLARNYQLKKYNSKSSSIRELDLSHCNLESIPTINMTNLTKLDFQGNHIRYISANSFSSFPFIHSLDLSNNAIVGIDSKAFADLKLVEHINISFNKISSIEFETFITNTKLRNLDLSRNYLSEVGQIIIESLKLLDVSVCEIRTINKNSLVMMPKLQYLNLSRNLITHLPNELHADELRVLDLSSCGIYHLNNLTFSAMRRLTHLSLVGNRLMSVKPNFFHTIKVLQMDDNAWLCDCASEEFKELHHWLYNFMSVSGLHCRFPENVAGLTWEQACADAWYVPDIANPDGMWIYSVSLVIFMTTLCCVVVSIRHAYYRKLARARRLQEIEREEAREQLRFTHQSDIHESLESIQRNAPDPRELQTPPSYAEAISMPRLNASCNSLVGSHRSLHSLHSVQSDTSTRRTKLRRKRRRQRQQNKSTDVLECQSAASLSHARTEESSSEEQQNILQPATNNANVIESSF